MAEQEAVIWGIRAGSTGQADDLFLRHKYIALGWDEMGDLGSIGANLEAFKDKVRACYPHKAAEKPGMVPNNAGQLFRFVHEMKPGDLAIYPSTRDRHIHIGRVTGPYRYDPTLEPEYPNLHPVEWLRSFPRTDFTQGALYEIGSAMTLFQVRNYADEFRAALEGYTVPPPVLKDESATQVVEDIEQTTRDFVLKRLAQQFKGHPLAHFVAHLLGAMGYRTRVSPPGPDTGIDIVANKGELGFEPPIIKVQVKSTEGSTGAPVVQALFGNVGAGEYGLFVTLGTFTNQARDFARTKSNLRLVDGDDLVDLILQHYEQFDARYKGLLPLKRVFVPDVDKPEEEA
jgi:restriction system protein